MVDAVGASDSNFHRENFFGQKFFCAVIYPIWADPPQNPGPKSWTEFSLAVGQICKWCQPNGSSAQLLTLCFSYAPMSQPPVVWKLVVPG